MMHDKRSLVDVIDQLVEMAPELKGPLSSVRDSACFAAPEMMSDFWLEAQEVLTATLSTTHPKFAELAAVWGGLPRLPAVSPRYALDKIRELVRGYGKGDFPHHREEAVDTLADIKRVLETLDDTERRVEQARPTKPPRNLEEKLLEYQERDVKLHEAYDRGYHQGYGDASLHRRNDDMQAMVREFHVACDHPAPSKPTLQHFRAALRARLIREEAEEFIHAADEYGPMDWPDMIDALCDLLYVTFGAAVEMGVPLAPFFREVHRANMAKVAGGKREDGKQLKPEGWEPPQIKELLDRLIERGTRPESKTEGWLNDLEAMARRRIW